MTSKLPRDSKTSYTSISNTQFGLNYLIEFHLPFFKKNTYCFQKFNVFANALISFESKLKTSICQHIIDHMSKTEDWELLNEQQQPQKGKCCRPMTKAQKITMVCVAVVLLIGAAVAICLSLFLKKKENPITVKNINVTLIGETYPDGQRITAVALDFLIDGSQEITVDNEKLSNSHFSIPERNITSIHSTSSLRNPHVSENGRYVIIELNPKDPGAPILERNDKIRYQGRKNVTYNIKQLENVQLTSGEYLQKTDNVYTNNEDINKAINLIVDDFVTETYINPNDPTKNLTYNIYIPKSARNNPKSNTKYPLLLFMHDASVMCNDTRMPLFQGVGATVWATKEDQQKREAFVVAPCFTDTIVNDSFMYTEQYTYVIPLLNEIINNKHKDLVDTKRIYTTGQSMGCMTSISLMCENPTFFASGMYVAGQWDPNIMVALANQTFWILVSEADAKAPKYQDIAMEILETNYSAKISRRRWMGNATEEEKARNVEDILSEGNDKLYIKFANHTVMPDDIPDRESDEHMYTWKVAYLIDGVRDWLFNQHLN